MPVLKIKMLANLCYNVPGEDAYGELTTGTIQKAVTLAKSSFYFASSAFVVDVGSGSGNTLASLVKMTGAFKGIGIEVSRERIKIARAIHKHRPYLAFVHTDVRKITTLPDGTALLYMFDKVFPSDLIQHILNLAFKSKVVVISTRWNELEMDGRWELVGKFAGRMKGSGSGCTVYVSKPSR